MYGIPLKMSGEIYIEHFINPTLFLLSKTTKSQLSPGPPYSELQTSPFLPGCGKSRGQGLSREGVRGEVDRVAPWHRQGAMRRGSAEGRYFRVGERDDQSEPRPEATEHGGTEGTPPRSIEGVLWL